MKIEADGKLEQPRIGDLFIVVANKNDFYTPYLIGHYDGKYILTNMHSGYSNYSAETVEGLVEDYIAKNKVKAVNLPKPDRYFFIKLKDAVLSGGKSFGHTKFE